MDLPWMSKKIHKMITHHKRLFWEAGGERTEAWRDYREKVDKEILRRKKGYLAQQKQHILAEDANRNVYKHVLNFSRLEKPKIFDVRSLLLGKSDTQAAECLADYFKRVSCEFDLLSPDQIPTTFGRELTTLQCWEVSKRI